MSIQDDYDQWSQWQHEIELERMHKSIEALEAAEKAGTPHELVIHLADECGVGDIYRKHYDTKGTDHATNP